MNDSSISSARPEVAWLLVRKARAVEQRLEAALEAAGLSLAKFGMLACLEEHGGKLALRALAIELSCVRSNVTQMIDRLEADGMARRVDDPDDRRSILAEITPEGRRRCRAAKEAFRRAEAELVASLGGSERGEAFRRMLQRVN